MVQIKFWRKPPNSRSIFGEDERFWYYCGAGKTIVSLLNKKIIPKGATIRIITRDFREDKWGFDSDWYKFAEEKLIEGIKIKAYGGPDREASGAVQKLSGLGMDVFEISAAPGKEPIKEHYVTVDNPPMIWAEAEHLGFYAFGCFYTEKPYEDAWFCIDKYFKDIEKQGKWFRHKSPCEMASNKQEDQVEGI